MPSFFPEGNTPGPHDTEVRSLQKVVGALADINVAVGGGSVASLQSASISTLSKTVAAANTPEVLGANTVKFRKLVLYGYKAARTANSGRVWVQHAAADGSVGAPILSTGFVVYEAPPGVTYDASQFYIDVESANDGVVGIYTV